MNYLNKRNKILLFLILSVFLFCSGLFVIWKKRPLIFENLFLYNEVRLNKNENVFGIYFKDTKVEYDTLQNFTNLILKINKNKSFLKNDRFLSKIPKKNSVLLTIEFWGDFYIYKSKDKVLEDITNGFYDDKVEEINHLISKINRKVYIRFNPEMELPLSIFPWLYDTEKYIESFRYLVQKMRNANPELNFVWGPAGFMGAEEMYPGDDVVDEISITLKSNYEGLYTRYPTYSDLADEIHRKLHRMRFFDKPIMILGTKKITDNKLVYNLINSEIDTIAKYFNIAYDDKLWNNQDTIVQPKKFIFGLHDPNQLLTSDSFISAEHVFVDFGQVQSGELKRLVNEVFERNHDLILTVEPWRDLSGKTDTNLLRNISGGKYDDIINKVFENISSSKHTVYLRFAHEMEIPITRYLWQSQDPVTYIEAFRYFMKKVQPIPPNVKRVWGPAGDRTSIDFYPGDDVVDYISFAIYGLPDKNITDPEKQLSFNTIFKYKIWRFRFLNKPFFITEFGVKGPEDYKTKWLEDAAKVLNENPEVVGINYFNMTDTPGAWGNIEAPDWSITPATLHHFMDILKRDNQ